MYKRTNLRRAGCSALLAGCILAVIISGSGCGGEDSGAAPAATPTPSPTSTPTPGMFTGNFAGTAALGSGQTGSVALTINNDQSATGTLTITGGTTPETVPLAGFAEFVTGNFSTSGTSADSSVTATVSGTLPASSGTSDVMVIQIGTNFYQGTISRT